MKVFLPLFPPGLFHFKSLVPLAFLLLAYTAVTGQTQNPFWVINDTYWVGNPNPFPRPATGQVDFVPNTPVIDTIVHQANFDPKGAVNGISDECGDLVVYVVNGELYDGDNNLITPLRDYRAEDNFEIPITQVFSSPDEYLIFYTREVYHSFYGFAVTPSYYHYNATNNIILGPWNLFDMVSPPGGGDLVPCAVFLGVRYAISPDFNKTGEKEIYVVGESVDPLEHFEIYHSRITPTQRLPEIDCQSQTPVVVSAISQSGADVFQFGHLGYDRLAPELELSPDGKYLCWGEMGVADGDWAALHVLETPFTNTAFNHHHMTLTSGWQNIAGIEFDATSSWLAVSGNIVPAMANWESILTFPLNYVLTGNLGGFTPIPNSDFCDNAMIELGYDGNFYANDGYQLLSFAIDPTQANPVSRNPADDILNWTYGGVPNLFFGCHSCYGLLPDQADGEIYYNPDCEGGGVDPDDPIWDDRKENLDPASQPFPNPLPIGEYLTLPSLSDVLPQVYELGTGLPVAIDAELYGDHWQIHLVNPQVGSYALVQEADVWLFEVF